MGTLGTPLMDIFLQVTFLDIQGSVPDDILVMSKNGPYKFPQKYIKMYVEFLRQKGNNFQFCDKNTIKLKMS